MELFKVWGSILIDDKDAISKLNKSDKKAKESAKALDNVKKSAAAVGKAMVVGAGLAVGALTSMAFKSAEATDRIDKMSQQLGLSRKGFQEWDYILSQNGVSIDSLKGGMKTLTNMTDDLRKGTKTSTDAFKRLGISMKDIDGKSQEEVFSMVVNGLQGVTDESQRAALANDLLGRSGADLAPLLNAGADSAENLRAKANDLGLVLSDTAIDAGVKFTDTMDSLKRSFGAVASEVGVEVMPILQSLADWVLENMPKIKAFASDAVDKVSEAFAWAKDNANWLIPVLGTLLGGFVALKIIGVITTLITAWSAITAAATGVATAFGTVLAFITSPIGLVVVAIAAVIAIIALLVLNFDKVKEGASKLWDSVKLFFGKIGDFIGNIFGGIKDKIKMPKFTITGSMNPLKWLSDGVPKLNVKWNAEGGIFKQPTIFNTSAGMQGVGEAGAEAIMPITKLKDYIKEAMNESGNTLNHSGTIRVEGINSAGQLSAVVDVIMGQLRKEVRLG